MKKINLIIISFFVCNFIYAQPVIQWQNTIGGSNHDKLTSLQQTADSGYILGGYSFSNISGDKTENVIGGYDYWIVKTDMLGNIQWQNTIGGNGTEFLLTIQQTIDGGYILGGYSRSIASGDKTENNWDTTLMSNDYWIVKTDAMGNLQWENTIGGTDNDQLYSVQQTTDGGYIQGGYSHSYISGDKTENNWGPDQSCDDYWMVKTDSMGNIQWQNTIGGTGIDELYSIQQTADGGYILGGWSGANISGDKTEDSNGIWDYWIVKTDAFGNIQWQNTIGGSDVDYLYSIQQTADAGYILGGYSYSNISGDKTENRIGGYDYWIVKTDSIGNIQWQNTIGGSGSDYLSSIKQTSDGGYILGGSSNSNISGDKTENVIGGYDYWIVKTDSIGNIQWQKTIGGTGSDGFFLNISISLLKVKVQQTTDGGYIVGSTSDSNISGDKTENSNGLEDYWIVKLSPPTGFEELAAHKTFSLSPNPATTSFTIYPEYSGRFTISEIEIYNTLGEKVFSKQQTTNDKQQTVNINQLLPGVYFVAVSDDKGNKITRKFIKM